MRMLCQLFPLFNMDFGRSLSDTCGCCRSMLGEEAPSPLPSLYYQGHKMVKDLQDLLQTWNSTQKPVGS